MSKYGASPEFERELQEVAAKYAHMIIPRREVPPRPLAEVRYPAWDTDDEHDG